MTDLENVALTGPGGVGLAMIAYLVKLYLDGRKDKREDTATERSSESGIVETSKSLITMMREHVAEENRLRREAEVRADTAERELEGCRDELQRHRKEEAQRLGFAAYYEDDPESRSGAPNDDPYRQLPAPGNRRERGGTHRAGDDYPR